MCDAYGIDIFTVVDVTGGLLVVELPGAGGDASDVLGLGSEVAAGLPFGTDPL